MVLDPRAQKNVPGPACEHGVCEKETFFFFFLMDGHDPQAHVESTAQIPSLIGDARIATNRSTTRS